MAAAYAALRQSGMGLPSLSTTAPLSFRSRHSGCEAQVGSKSEQTPISRTSCTLKYSSDFTEGFVRRIAAVLYAVAFSCEGGEKDGAPSQWPPACITKFSPMNCASAGDSTPDLFFPCVRSMEPAVSQPCRHGSGAGAAVARARKNAEK